MLAIVVYTNQNTQLWKIWRTDLILGENAGLKVELYAPVA